MRLWLFKIFVQHLQNEGQILTDTWSYLFLEVEHGLERQFLCKLIRSSHPCSWPLYIHICTWSFTGTQHWLLSVGIYNLGMEGTSAKSTSQWGRSWKKNSFLLVPTAEIFLLYSMKSFSNCPCSIIWTVQTSTFGLQQKGNCRAWTRFTQMPMLKMWIVTRKGPRTCLHHS